MAEIRSALQALRWRMAINRFLSSAARATLFFYGLLVVLRAVAWWGGQTRPDPASLPYMLSWPFILGALGGLLVTLFRWPTLAMAAARADAVAPTRDRMVSSLVFSQRSEPSELEFLAIEETRAWLKTKGLGPAVPIRFPRELFWLAVPLATLALLWWHETVRSAAREAAAAAAHEQVAPTVKSLEAVARQLDQRAELRGEDALRKIADRLRESATQMRAEAEQGGDGRRAALREISELEQLVNQLRQPEAITTEELKSIAETLAKMEETKGAAKDMQENRFAEAAEQLDEASKSPDAEKIEAELKNAVDHLARRREQRSRQMEEMQKRAENQPAGERGRLVPELAEMLREMAQPKAATAQGKQPEKQEGKGGEADKQAQKQEGKGISDEDLKKLLGALQEMKNQQQQQEPSGEQGEGDPGGEESTEGTGPITMLSFQESPDADPVAELGVPSGQPGSERDEGTTKDPFAPATGEAAEAKRQEQLKGQLGEGESLSALMPAASSGDVRASRRYKELTEAANASAEEAVSRENIPLGSRMLIRRYFESIRPKD